MKFNFETKCLKNYPRYYNFQNENASNAKSLKRSEIVKKVYVNKDRTIAERIFENQLRTRHDSLNSLLEQTHSVNGIDRKYGVSSGLSEVTLSNEFSSTSETDVPSNYDIFLIKIKAMIILMRMLTRLRLM